METLGTARLADEVESERAVIAFVPREEIATVLRDPEAQPELQLEIRGGDEPSRISMSWSRGELEDLLERATGETVVLTFDRDELADAFADVEAHGFRQKAMVFTVAAAGALGSGVGIANAQQMADVGAGASAPAAHAIVTPRSVNPDLGAQQSRGAALPAPSASSEFLGVQAPDTTDAFIVGGVLLTLAGATFASRRVRPTRPV